MAASADSTRLESWQEQAVLEALQDPSVQVRYGAVDWLSNKQAKDRQLARQLAEYLHSVGLGLCTTRCAHDSLRTLSWQRSG